MNALFQAKAGNKNPASKNSVNMVYPLKILYNAKKITCFIICYSLIINTYASPFSSPTDTTKTIANYITNKKFNEIYIQNLKPATFGQEFFDPLKTLLVSDLVSNFVVYNTPRSRFFFVIIPRVKIRLFSEDGSPVRSPSYMPGGTLYFRINNNPYNSHFFSIAYSHHSNGIRGPTVYADGSFNRDSGKFTTNFYTLTYHSGKRTNRTDRILNRYDELGLELHAGLINKGVAFGLKDHYGFVRLNGARMYSLAHAVADPINKNIKSFKDWQRLQLEFTYIMDKYDDYTITNFKKRLNISLKYYYQFPFMQNTSFLICAGYRGQDDYNMFFEDSYPYVMMGLASGLTFGSHKN